MTAPRAFMARISAAMRKISEPTTPRASSDSDPSTVAASPRWPVRSTGDTSRPLEVGVARQPFLVHAQHRARLFQGHAVGAHGHLGKATHARHKVLARVADVFED